MLCAPVAGNFRPHISERTSVPVESFTAPMKVKATPLYVTPLTRSKFGVVVRIRNETPTTKKPLVFDTTLCDQVRLVAPGSVVPVSPLDAASKTGTANTRVAHAVMTRLTATARHHGATFESSCAQAWNPSAERATARPSEARAILLNTQPTFFIRQYGTGHSVNRKYLFWGRREKLASVAPATVVRKLDDRDAASAASRDVTTTTTDGHHLLLRTGGCTPSPQHMRANQPQSSQRRTT